MTRPPSHTHLEETFTDWNEKLNRDKTETLVLTPGATPETNNKSEAPHRKVRHVGGILNDAGTQWADTLHRYIMAKKRAKDIAKAWSTGTSHGRGNTSRVKIATRLRIMLSVVVPTLTTFGRSRAWTKSQIRSLQAVQTYALRRCFGLDKLLVRDHHITTEALHKAAQWPMIEQVLLVNTLRWLGHVAQMPAHRLPKQALWGFWADGSFRPRHATTHIQWIHRTLQYADIHEMHWFRLAQNTEDTTWDTLLRRAFPRHILNNRGKRAISAWKPGRPLPDTTVRRRRTRNVWVRPASMLSNKECPACGKVCANAHERRTHYNQTHAVTGLHLTTIPTFQCKECLRHFHNAWTLASHSCPAIHQLPIPEGADETGWKPLRVPQLNPPPREWTLYTDGSGGTAAHPQAGWGLAVYDAADTESSNCLFFFF